MSRPTHELAVQLPRLHSGAYIHIAYHSLWIKINYLRENMINWVIFHLPSCSMRKLILFYFWSEDHLARVAEFRLLLQDIYILTSLYSFTLINSFNLSIGQYEHPLFKEPITLINNISSYNSTNISTEEQRLYIEQQNG